MRLHRCFYTVTCCSYLRCAKTIPCANPGMVGVVGPVRSGPSRRSIVAADIEINNAAVTSGMISSSKRRSRTTNSAMTGARRLPVGQPAPPSKTPAPPPPAHTEAAAGRGAGRASASTPPSCLTGVVAVPPCGCAQLIEDPALLRLARALVPRRDRLGHRMFLAHIVSPIHQGLPAPTQPPLQARPSARTPA